MVTLQNAFFGRIANREAAIDFAKWAALGFFLAAAFVAFFAFLAWPRLLFVAVTYAICGYFTRYKFSRLAVVDGVSLSVLCFLVPFVFPESRSGMLFALVIWFGVRGIEATFKLHGRFSLQSSSQNT
ncbi:hypothetical protein ACFPPA_09170 [Rhodanobacter ginsengisoli]|uniref:Uncharacterized protein n=1 Tax=Rhodanobacter ginsengisoli TaxID=418646 RepID=A0ABW0QMV4_9GAMM